ncbi:universal stress protein [Actinopolymorpha alba]|uniref:universal stress protein n=1 Tax=Actinopolymorpha alba TaxID=533267 RepID=UPI00037699FA|nr:universal stress protein [Actinopolymorpha alba]
MPRTFARPALVVGVDGSENSLRALDWAVEEAARRDSPVRMVYAFELAGRRTLARPQSNMAEMYAEGTEVFAAARAHLGDRRGASFVVGTALHEGRPSQVLIDLTTRAQMCVVGRRGRSRLASFVLGSTSMALAVRLRIPLVVVPPEWRPDDGGTSPVLVGLDPRSHSEAALAFAFDAAGVRAAPLVVVSAWDLPSPDAFGPDAAEGAISRRQVEFCRMLAATLTPWREKYPKVDVSTVCERAHPVSALTERSAGASLLVLGGHGDPTPLRGAIARGVLRRASCPVALVREPSAPAYDELSGHFLGPLPDEAPA